MSTERLLLSEKYKAFLRCNAPVEYLEYLEIQRGRIIALFFFEGVIFL